MPINWGVIGAGGIADRRTIPEGLMPCPDANLVAVQDVAEDRVQAVAEKYAVKAVYTSVYDLLNDPRVQAVYIATPPASHFGMVMAAARAGKHILCEKPLGLSRDDCEAMVEECVAKDVLLGVNFMMRFHACHVALKQMIEAGDLGTLVMGRAELTCWYPPIPGAFRQDLKLGGGGSFIDMGNHCVDLLEWLFGSMVREVKCTTVNLVQDYASEDTAVAMLQFENEAVGVVDALFNVPDAAARNALEVYGSKGSVYSFGTIGQGSGGQLKAVLEKGDKGYDAGQTREEVGEQIIEPPVVNIYQAHIQAFCDAIANGTPPPITGEDAVWSHRVVEACYKSAREHRTVQV